MNKKVSTIFAMAALMGGVFSGSAYAQTTTVDLSASEALDKVEATTAEVLLTQNGKFLGVKVDPDTKEKSLVAESGEQKVSVKDYFLWTVTVIPPTSNNDHVKYTFTNKATGEYLSFKIADQSFAPVATDKVDATKDAYVFTFKGSDGENAPYAGESEEGKTDKVQQLYTEAEFEVEGATPGSTEEKALALDIESGELTESTITADLNINKLEDASVSAQTLNKWYNGKGFNLESNPSTATGNLFEGDTRIWAFDVPSGGYYYTTSDNEQLLIPEGTYFFTEPKFLNGYTEVSIIDKISDATKRAAQIDWLNSTLIAVSSTETSEATNADRGAGEGFKLITAKGSDFVLQSNVSKFEGDDLPIWNACFTVEDNYDATAPYSIKLSKFYYRGNVSDPMTEDLDIDTKHPVYIGVTGYNGSDYRVVSMRESDELTAQHAFYFSDSAVKDGRELLNETKTAAVYNIKFVSGNNDLKDKYLTVGLGSNGFRYEAKGEAIVDKDYPAFQWVITRAKAEEEGAKPWKYTEVTFTNRETGEQFTTKLYNETASGENCYSLLMENDLNITPFTVNTQSANTYVAEQLKNVEYNANIIVKLEPVETVDQYAGFLKVDNKTIRTLAFARDKNDTSNKLFAAVKYENSVPVSLNEDDKFVSDIYDAAQWQLVRVATTTATRTFVYNNTTTESVDDVAQGDKITAYRYALRYVVDGTETDYYLASKTAADGALMEVEEENVADSPEWKNGTISFIIKENVDGSVSLLPSDARASENAGSNSYNPFIKSDAKKVVEVYYNEGREEYQYEYGDEATYSTLEQKNGHNLYSGDAAKYNETGSLEIRTYLDPQPIEISWPAHEGHVTLKSELGNYITMNEDRDGIVVNENDGDTYYLYVTDEKAVVPSFYITKGVAAENGERMYLFNPTDSAAYYVTPEGKYSRIYQWNEDNTKVMFKSGIINETRDTLTLTVKGEADKKVAMEADDNDKNIWGGLNRFKWQIIEAGDEAEGLYYIRQPKADNNANDDAIGTGEVYLANWNDKLTWSDKTNALLFEIESVAAPTANEGVSATEVKIIATDGAVNVKNAAGKNVVISTILGQIVANEVLTSDNATISVPAGIAIVSVDGEEAVKVSVR